MGGGDLKKEIESLRTKVENQQATINKIKEENNNLQHQLEIERLEKEHALTNVKRLEDEVKFLRDMMGKLSKS